MLRELHISGLGVIEDLDLELHRGLNVLTGETGAGKTMVTVGLSLAIGARASASMVRTGSAAMRVQARFDAPDPAGDWAMIDVLEVTKKLVAATFPNETPVTLVKLVPVMTVVVPPSAVPLVTLRLLTVGRAPGVTNVY